MDKIPYTGPIRFAHTGLSQYAPENTLDAFRRAAAMGCEGIELDIRADGDGEIIVTHNDNLEYMTRGADKRKLHDLTTAQVQAVDIPYRNALLPALPPVPWTEGSAGRKYEHEPDDPECRITHLSTFAQVDRWITENNIDMTIEIEFKECGMLPRMEEILTSSPNTSKYIFFSGEDDVLAEMQERYRRIPKPEGLRLGANIRFLNEKTLAFIENSDLYEVGLNNEAFDKKDVDMLAEKGIKVFSNLGDYEEWWERLAAMGVAGFKTNYAEAYTYFVKKHNLG